MPDGYITFPSGASSWKGIRTNTVTPSAWDTQATFDVALDVSTNWSTVPASPSIKPFVSQYHVYHRRLWMVAVHSNGRLRVYYKNGLFTELSSYTVGTGVVRKYLRVTINPAAGQIRVYDRADSDIHLLTGWSEVAGSPVSVTPWTPETNQIYVGSPMGVNAYDLDSGAWGSWDFYHAVMRDSIGGSIIAEPDARTATSIDWGTLAMLDAAGVTWGMYRGPTWSLSGSAVDITPSTGSVTSNRSTTGIGLAFNDSYGLDGDGTDYWPHFFGTQWVKFDLGTAKPVGVLRVDFLSDTFGFQIETSLDDVAWSTVYGPADHPWDPVGVNVFINQYARYIRITDEDQYDFQGYFEFDLWDNIHVIPGPFAGKGTVANAGSGSLSVDKLLLGWGDVVSAGSARLVVDYSVAGAGLVVSEGWAYLHRVGEVDFLARRGGGNVSSGLGVLSVAEATTLRVVVQVTDVEFVAVLTAEMSGVVVPPGGVPPGRGGIVGRGVVVEDDEYRRRVHRLKHSTQRR